jgi:hypothetical protein
MHKQPRNSNNPANPLLKVAALDIKRSHEKRAKRASCRVHINLNFKKSSDIRGNTFNEFGEDITVNFTLSIHKASFELEFAFENPRDNKFVCISNVAFIEGLSTNQRVDLSHEIDSSINIEGSISGEATLGANANPIAKVTAATKGQKTIERKRNSKHKVNANYSVTGISATHAGNIINWSIDSIWTRKEEFDHKNDLTYLSGEVFRDTGTGKTILACKVNWNYSQVSTAMEIHGSVRVMMQDLIVENIIFLDSSGNEQSWDQIKKLRSENVSLSLRNKMQLDRDQFKHRLIRQIIRKHLISQGMQSDGASIEICSARG